MECDERSVRLESIGSCSDCVGCGGRCNLFRETTQGRIELPREDFDFDPSPGQKVRLLLPDRWLRDTAWRVYGWATFALIAGAVVGQLLGQLPVFSGYANLLALIGASGGTLLALRASKARPVQVRVEPVGSDPLPRASGCEDSTC